EHVALGLEQLAQPGCGPAGPLVLAVRRRVTGVRGDDGVYDGLVCPSVVVTSKTLVLSHAPNLLRRVSRASGAQAEPDRARRAGGGEPARGRSKGEVIGG